VTRPTSRSRSATRTTAAPRVPARTPKRRDQEVLDAAVKVFHRKGYADASIQDIADELGILKGSLYHYIDTKEDLLFRLMEKVHAEYHALTSEVQAMEDLEPLERLAEYVRVNAEFVSRHLPEMAVYYADFDQLSPERRRAIARSRRADEKFATGLIEELQARGQASADLDAATLSRFMFGTVAWIHRWYRPNGRLRPPELAEMCVRYVLGGVVGGVRPGD
jgi:AcrR family transcriptional regulator